MISSRTILTCALVGVLMSNVGCASFWHDLRPHRLQRMNRGAPPSLDPEFTSHRRNAKERLARTTNPRDASTLTANSAEIATL